MKRLLSCLAVVFGLLMMACPNPEPAFTPSPKYSVTYHGNGATSGACPVDTGQYYQGHQVTILGNTGNLAKPGYSFSNWNTQADGKGEGLDPGCTLVMREGNLDLYATWMQDPIYSVKYDANGAPAGSLPVDTKLYGPHDSAILLPATGLAWAGRKFVGWMTKADGTGSCHAVGETISMPASDVTLYAAWVQESMVVWILSNQVRLSGFSMDPVGAVDIPASISVIEDGAFVGATALTAITIPASVSSVSGSAFQECPNLATITVDDANPNYRTIAGVLYTKDGSIIVKVPCPATEIDIPDTVTTIGECAFSDCVNLAAFALPPTVRKVKNGAFSNCPGLTEIPSTLEEIGWQAFISCTGLTQAVIPPGTTLLGLVFMGCSNLASVSIPPSVTEIYDYAFYGCGRLTSVSLPVGLKTIGEYAFYQSGLTSLILPSSVTSLGKYCFADCGDLTTAILSGSLTEIPSGAFANCAISSITIPNSVKYIRGAAFSDCGLLSSIDFGTGVVDIENFAFQFCEALASITLPPSVGYISGGNTFAYCYALTDVTFKAIHPPLGMGSQTFGNCPALLRIHVPAASLADYRDAPGWETYSALLFGY
jgi:hypothetical protein